MKRRIFVAGSVMLMTATMLAIWLFSDQNATQSSSLSGELAVLLKKMPIVRVLVQLDESGLILRKLSHVAIYAVLGLNMSAALRSALTTRGTLGLSLSLGTLYAVSDEFHQSFVPGRLASLRDVLIDIGGLILGICIGVWVCQKIMTSKSPGPE